MENIFGKKLDEIETKDLIALRDVSEGWFYEYKEKVVSPDAAAKSLTSFANTYGGWLFYGIKGGKESKTAESFCGLSTSEIGNADTWIRQASSGHMSPAVYYEHRVFQGPSEQLGLQEERSIIVIRIPQGNNPPYVHCRGRIYRRVADESDPRPETDRHFLDLLWGRSNALRTEIAETLRLEPPRQKIENRHPVVRIVIFHDIWKQREAACTFRDLDFYNLMLGGCLIFDTAYPTSEGYLARQAKHNNPLGLLFDWHHRSGCIDEITIPLNTYRLDDLDEISQLRNYNFFGEFAEILLNNIAAEASIVDVSILYNLLISICSRLGEVLQQEDVKNEVVYKVQIGGMSGRVPFLDAEWFPTTIRKYGLPVTQANLIYAPPGLSPESFDPILNHMTPRSDSEKDPMFCTIMNATKMFITIIRSLGIAVEGTGLLDSADKIPEWHDSLQNAAIRYYEASLIKRDEQAGDA